MQIFIQPTKLTVRLHLVSLGDLITGIFPVQYVTLDLFMLQAHTANWVWTSPSRYTSSTSNMACLFKKLPFPSLIPAMLFDNQSPSLPSSTVLLFPHLQVLLFLSPTNTSGISLPCFYFQCLFISTAMSYPSQWSSKWPIRLL